MNNDKRSATLDLDALPADVLQFSRIMRLIQTLPERDDRAAALALVQAEAPELWTSFVSYLGHHTWVAAHADCDATCAHCHGNPAAAAAL